MSATNLTKNLKLSQFVASDKPSWLGDVNGDNKKIDDGYGVLAGEISKANDTASSAKSQSDANTQTLTNVNSELEDYGNRITALEAGGGTEQLEQRVNTLGTDVEALQTRADTFEENISQNGTNITRLTERMTAVEGKAKTNEDNITSLNATVNGLNDNVQSVSSTATKAKTNADLALNNASSANTKATTAQNTAESAKQDVTNISLNSWDITNKSLIGNNLGEMTNAWFAIKGGDDNKTNAKTIVLLPTHISITSQLSSGAIIFSFAYNENWTPYESALGSNFPIVTNRKSLGITLYFEKDISSNRINVRMSKSTSGTFGGEIEISYAPPILFNVG